MKLFVAILGWGLACVMGHAQSVQLLFSQPPNTSGTLTWTASLVQPGRKVTQSNLVLTASGRRLTVRMESVFAADGAPLRMISETVSGTALLQRIVADFRPDGVHLSGERASKKLNQVVAYPEGAPWKDVGEFWFLRDQPKPGAKLLTYRFSLEDLQWRIQERHYVGRSKKKMGNREWEGHLVQVDGGEFLLDDRGDPIWIETTTGATLTRKEKTKP